MFDPSIVPTIDQPDNGPASFTVQQANLALPYVSRIVADITEVYSQILELRSELESLDDGDLRNLTEREYETTMDRLGELVDELHHVGVELRDFELGRVDFPSTRGDREVMLTWQSGHDRVRFWHEISANDDTLYPIDGPRDASEAA